MIFKLKRGVSNGTPRTKIIPYIRKNESEKMKEKHIKEILFAALSLFLLGYVVYTFVVI